MSIEPVEAMRLSDDGNPHTPDPIPEKLAELVTAAADYTIGRAKPAGAATNSGYRGAAVNIAARGKARSCTGGAIFLVYRDSTGAILHARGFVVGKDAGIKPDTFYTLDAEGNPVEAD